MESMSYQFAAIRGMQAGREYFVIMCPLKLIPKIFLFDEEELPVELRSQRTLNQSRIPEMSSYLVQNPEDYVFSAITASVDGQVDFIAEGADGYQRNIGVLNIPMKADFVINDGQHRRAAIEEAIKENPDLGDESISVVLFIDAGLSRCQQMFSDLNRHAIRPTKSLSILYDRRDSLSAMAVEISNKAPIFIGLTEAEKTSISNRSINLFTLNAIFQASQVLLGKSKKDNVTSEEIDLAVEYWTKLGEIIPEWRLIIKRQISSDELRRNFVHSHGVMLLALGIAGAELIATYPDEWQTHIPKLADIDWRRANQVQWEGRAMRRGRMSKAKDNVTLTASLLKKYLELPLSTKELELEEILKAESYG